MSAIGPHTFIRISKLPAAPQEGIVIESQAGVAGATAWLMGPVGKTTNVTTVRDCISQADAIQTSLIYQLLPSLGPQPISIGQTVLPFRVKVLEVEPLRADATVLGVGGINGTSKGIVIARWTLLSWVSP